MEQRRRRSGPARLRDGARQSRCATLPRRHRSRRAGDLPHRSATDPAVRVRRSDGRAPPRWRGGDRGGVERPPGGGRGGSRGPASGRPHAAPLPAGIGAGQRGPDQHRHDGADADRRPATRIAAARTDLERRHRVRHPLRTGHSPFDRHRPSRRRLQRTGIERPLPIDARGAAHLRSCSRGCTVGTSDGGIPVAPWHQPRPKHPRQPTRSDSSTRRIASSTPHSASASVSRLPDAIQPSTVRCAEITVE